VQSLDHRTILFQTNDNSKTNCQVSKNKRVMSQKLVKSYEKNKIETYYLLLHPIFHFCFIFFTFSYFCTTTILQAFIALPYSLKPLLTVYYSHLQIIFCKPVTKLSYQTISCSLKSGNTFLVRHTFLSPLVKEIDTKKCSISSNIKASSSFLIGCTHLLQSKRRQQLISIKIIFAFFL
jgi:hypothetical protein